MQCINLEAKRMSFDFSSSNNFNQLRTHSTYKDGGGLGGGGMYMKQGKKRQDQPDEDMFEYKDESCEEEIVFDKEIEEKDIPQDTLFNKFVNWFRIQND